MFAATQHHTNNARAKLSDQTSGAACIDELVDALVCTSSPEWNAAACRHAPGEDNGLFFSNDIAEINRAILVCAACPLRARCLQGALDRHEPCGVWGGHLFANGRVLTQKRPRGRPRKNGSTQGLIPLIHRTPGSPQCAV